MPDNLRHRKHLILRYSVAVVAVAAAFLLREGLMLLAGGSLPTYITFYPAVMTVALLAGVGPGLVATTAAALAVDYWILPPQGSLSVASLADAIGLAFFSGMGVFMSVMAELYRRARQKAAARDTDFLLRDGREAAPRRGAQGLLLNLGLALSLVILAAVGGLCARDLLAVAEADRWQTHSYVVIEQLDRLLSALKDAETGQRGYLLTGEEKYLEPYQAALDEAQTNLANLKQLTLDNPRQQQRLALIEPLVQEKDAESKQAIELRRAQGLPAALAVVATDKGKALMDQIRQQVAAAQDEEQSLLQQRAAAKAARAGKTIQALLAGGVLSFLLLVTTFLFLRQENARRTKAEVEVRHHRDHLQQIVDARTAELRESERQFRTLADSIPNLAWWANADGYLTWYNRRWYEYTGTTPEQMEGWGWQSVHDPKTLPAVLERWKTSIATGQPFDMTFPLRGAGGIFRPFLTRVMPLRDEQGRVQQWFGTNTDVSEQKRAEELHARLAAIVESSDDAILSKDLDGVIRSWNAGAERLFGYQDEEIIGRPITLLLPPERQDEETKIMARLQAGERLDHFETVRLTKDQRQIEVSVTVSPLRDAEGQITGASKIVRDITERRRAAAQLRQAHEQLAREASKRRQAMDALRELNAELEQRVAAQTTELHKANEMLEQRVAQRTAELAAANETLAASRVAAINLMEDAIEARRQAEQAATALRSASEQRRLALEASELGAWDYHLDTGEVSWDECCRNMWGISAGGQIDYSGAVGRIHPEDQAHVDQAVKQAVAGAHDGAYHREFRVLWPDGSEHWIASHGRVYFEGEGQQRRAVRFIGVNREITREKLAEEAIRRNTALLQAVTDHSPDPIFLKDRDSRLLLANPATLAAIGKPAEQVVGKTDLELYEDRAVGRAMIENDRRVIESGQAEAVEETIPSPAGPRVFLSTKSPYRDVEGRVVGVIGIARDITERKQKEAELQKLNRALNALKESSQAMNRATSETDYLREVCRDVVANCGHAMVWIGFAQADEGQTVRPVAHAGFEEGYLETLRISWGDNERGRGPTGSAIRTGTPCSCKDMLADPAFAPWRAEARRRGYAASIALPLLSEGKAFGAITIYSRQTDPFSEDEARLLAQLADDVAYCIVALRARAAKTKAEQRTELLAETAAQLLATDAPQRVVDSLCHKLLEFLDCQVFFNFLVDAPGHLRLNASAGISPDEVRKIESLDYGVAVCGCAARDACRIVADDLQASSDPRTELVKSFGIQAYACHPLLIEGRVLGTLSLGTRTRTRFAADELSMMQAVADQVAIAMERKRVQEALRSTAEDLERSNRDLEQFAYIASHDLQEPLRAVGGYVKLLQRRFPENVDPKAREFIAGAAEGATRMERLITDLLAFSRVGTRGGHFALANLNDTLAEALRNLQTSIESSGAKVTHDPLPTLSVDATQMIQLFQNLIGNAIKFRSEQPPEIHVGVQPLPGRWVFSARDNGIGIESQYFERIFQIFQRLHTRKVYPGTGIGLAICKKIVERHGGAIWLESQPERGTTFYFSMPANSETPNPKQP